MLQLTLADLLEPVDLGSLDKYQVKDWVFCYDSRFSYVGQVASIDPQYVTENGPQKAYEVKINKSKLWFLESHILRRVTLPVEPLERWVVIDAGKLAAVFCSNHFDPVLVPGHIKSDFMLKGYLDLPCSKCQDPGFALPEVESIQEIRPQTDPQDPKIQDLTPSPEPELQLTPEPETINVYSESLPAIVDPVADPEPLVPGSRLPDRPLPKPVKLDQVGSIEPTQDELSQAIMHVLKHAPGFASLQMLGMSLPGAPWLFKINNLALVYALDDLENSRMIEKFKTDHGVFYRLPVNQASELAPVIRPVNDPAIDPVPEAKPKAKPPKDRALYGRSDLVCVAGCRAPMTAINGSNQYRCQDDFMHHFDAGQNWFYNGRIQKGFYETPNYARTPNG